MHAVTAGKGQMGCPLVRCELVVCVCTYWPYPVLLLALPAPAHTNLVAFAKTQMDKQPSPYLSGQEMWMFMSCTLKRIIFQVYKPFTSLLQSKAIHPLCMHLTPN